MQVMETRVPWSQAQDDPQGCQPAEFMPLRSPLPHSVSTLKQHLARQQRGQIANQVRLLPGNHTPSLQIIAALAKKLTAAS